MLHVGDWLGLEEGHDFWTDESWPYGMTGPGRE